LLGVADRWRGCCGAGANHGVGQGSARKRSGARPRVVQTEKVPEAGDRQRAGRRQQIGP